MQRTVSTSNLFNKISTICQQNPSPATPAQQAAADYFQGKERDVAIAKARTLLDVSREALSQHTLPTPVVRASMGGVLSALQAQVPEFEVARKMESPRDAEAQRVVDGVLTTVFEKFPNVRLDRAQVRQHLLDEVAAWGLREEDALQYAGSLSANTLNAIASPEAARAAAALLRYCRVIDHDMKALVDKLAVASPLRPLTEAEAARVAQAKAFFVQVFPTSLEDVMQLEPDAPEHLREYHADLTRSLYWLLADAFEITTVEAFKALFDSPAGRELRDQAESLYVLPYEDGLKAHILNALEPYNAAVEAAVAEQAVLKRLEPIMPKDPQARAAFMRGFDDGAKAHRAAH